MKTFHNLFVLGFFSFLITQSATAQRRVNNSTIVYITVNDISLIEAKLNNLLKAKNLKPSKFNKSANNLEAQLFVNQMNYDDIVAEYKTWGYISSENSTQTTYEFDVKILNEDIAQLQKERIVYQSLAKYADSTSKPAYLTYIEKIIEIDKAILSNEKKLIEYQSGATLNYLQIQISEESNSTMEYSSSWVNMPGLEYSSLWIEQPVQGATPSIMQGMSLKYMFNTGKSYGILGLYKNFGAKTEVDQMFTFAFGQDFYSRRMGRGQRKFLNLYTSFNAGVYVLTGDEQRSASWYINPYLGLELFKNKYFLIDNKVGYFLPYRDNRNMRGLLYNFSFNFVF